MNSIVIIKLRNIIRFFFGPKHIIRLKKIEMPDLFIFGQIEAYFLFGLREKRSLIVFVQKRRLLIGHFHATQLSGSKIDIGLLEAHCAWLLHP